MSNYQLVSNMSNYQLVSNMSNYPTLSGTNNFTGNNNFLGGSSNITITNYNFSSTTAGNNTPILSNVTGTNSITGWTFSGTAYYICIYSTTNSSPNNRYIPNSPSPSSTYLLFETSTVNTSGDIFTLTSNSLSLSVGCYTIFFSSYWGVISSSALISVKIGFVIVGSYNDLTRNNGLWSSHTYQFNITTAGNYNISFVYTNNTATVSSVFDACFSNITITKYNGIQESDGTNLSLFINY
jgi:hypothetical protein